MRRFNLLLKQSYVLEAESTGVAVIVTVKSSTQPSSTSTKYFQKLLFLKKF